MPKITNLSILQKYDGENLSIFGISFFVIMWLCLSKIALIITWNLSKNFGRKFFQRLQIGYRWCIISLKWWSIPQSGSKWWISTEFSTRCWKPMCKNVWKTCKTWPKIPNITVFRQIRMWKTSWKVWNSTWKTGMSAWVLNSFHRVFNLWKKQGRYTMGKAV